MTATDPESLGFSTTRLARIASWYQVHVEAGDLPGAVVAIARNGKLAYLKGIGFQDRSKAIPMNPDAIFWIASMTKPVTSVAAMMLVEEGKLDLDAPVSRYLGITASVAATCRASVPRYGQSREKRRVRGEPAGYELGEEPHALRLARLAQC
jgi:CubicO group peptidase (beta-lactamase class C family)